MSAEELKKVLEAEIERLKLHDWSVRLGDGETAEIFLDGKILQGDPEYPWTDLGGDGLVMKAVIAGAWLVESGVDEKERPWACFGTAQTRRARYLLTAQQKGKVDAFVEELRARDALPVYFVKTMLELFEDEKNGR